MPSEDQLRLQARPDLAGRPYGARVERQMAAGADAIYLAWTQRFDTWFATPGTLRMRGEAGEPFYFSVAVGDLHHPHYGRFLALDPGRAVELTWVTGAGGTDGAETVIQIELTAAEPGPGTQLVLTHAGFYTERAARAAQDAWPQVLAHLDEALLAGNSGDQATEE